MGSRDAGCRLWTGRVGGHRMRGRNDRLTGARGRDREIGSGQQEIGRGVREGERCREKRLRRRWQRRRGRAPRRKSHHQSNTPTSMTLLELELDHFILQIKRKEVDPRALHNIELSSVYDALKVEEVPRLNIALRFLVSGDHLNGSISSNNHHCLFSAAFFLNLSRRSSLLPHIAATFATKSSSPASTAVPPPPVLDCYYQPGPFSTAFELVLITAIQSTRHCSLKQTVASGSMFCLSLIEHNLPLPPHMLNRPLLGAIREELEKMFLDKVISNLGLCISVYDIQSIEGGFVFPGDGASNYKVVFRLVMFRPFVGEILCGKLKASDADGLHVSLGFFDDIHIPVHLLPHKSKMGEDGIWIWEHECGDLPLDLDEEVHFRVTKISYPSIPVEQDVNVKPFAPMEIIGEIYGDGLGLLSWWAD
ncbi:DNA-directed RNA polymerase III subunit RPC8 isoform X1 [Canna indica]|uniref:DNA-directed RNA polymerase subunit n=1 Tax=Canna indica TaxID=4628 RepID=A0AAQ3K6H6_9LILI|nr:DNA-directed RNA polymerase III subunit RPC8 isoform X1 [Canna indica]